MIDLVFDVTAMGLVDLRALCAERGLELRAVRAPNGHHEATVPVEKMADLTAIGEFYLVE